MLLLVTATPRELAPLRAALSGASTDEVHGLTVHDGELAGAPVRLASTGLGRAATAFTLSRLLLDRPTACLQVGVGGSFDPHRLPVGGVAVASSDTYADLGVRTDEGWIGADELGFPLVERAGRRWYATFACDAPRSQAAADRLGVPLAAFATVETVTGTAASAQEVRDRTGALVESMEGAAGAHACTVARVPFVQVRAVSNVVGPRDRGAWRLDEAIEVAADAATRVVGTVLDSPAPS